MWLSVLLGAIGLALCGTAMGCLDRSAFVCANDGECVRDDESGTCEANGSCSFADASCESGRRFGEFSPEGVADRCTNDVLGEVFCVEAPIELDINIPSPNAAAPTTNANGVILIIEVDANSQTELAELTRSPPSLDYGSPRQIGEISMPGDARDPSLSSDGLRLYFASSRNGDLDLFEATRDNPTDDFRPPTVVSVVNSSADDFDPEISDDGRTLAFASTRGGTRELFLSVRNNVGAPFGEPRRLDELTVDGEEAPALISDRLTLFWAADGDGLDLFAAERETPGADFGVARAVAAANSSADDSSPTTFGNRLLFDSNRNGSFAIYSSMICEP